MILVDVGVWLASAWERHIHHDAGKRWLDGAADQLIMCRVTQMSLLRLISNSAVLGEDAVTRAAAWLAIDEFLSDDRVVWADEPDDLETVFRAFSARTDHSHRLWTDDYLAAFAHASGASLATLDGKLKKRYPSVRIEQVVTPSARRNPA